MEENKRYTRSFTMEDYENGICDINGKPLPGGPKEPPPRPSKAHGGVPTRREFMTPHTMPGFVEPKNPNIQAKVPGQPPPREPELPVVPQGVDPNAAPAPTTGAEGSPAPSGTVPEKEFMANMTKPAEEGLGSKLEADPA